jgi:UDP-N-acetylmuramyl pentapeptide phosphotransferase/UDP-N-acetylglucosamine-1-phosphate transferase
MSELHTGIGVHTTGGLYIYISVFISSLWIRNALHKQQPTCTTFLPRTNNLRTLNIYCIFKITFNHTVIFSFLSISTTDESPPLPSTSMELLKF